LINFAANHVNWFNPYNLTAYIELSSDAHEVDKSFFSSIHSEEVAKKIQAFFHAVKAKRRVARLLAAMYPELYLVSVNSANNVSGVSDNQGLFAYVSGLVIKPTNNDIFSEQNEHKTTVPVCVARTPTLTTTSAEAGADAAAGQANSQKTAHYVALAGHSAALSFLSVTLVNGDDTLHNNDEKHEPLGIAFIPISDIPPRSVNRETPYSTTLQLEPYLVPDLSVYAQQPHQPHQQQQQQQSEEGLVEAGEAAEAVAVDDESVVSSLAASGSVVTANTTTPRHPGSPSPPPLRTTLLTPRSRRRSVNRVVSGSVSVTVSTPNPMYSMCGWLAKRSEKSLVITRYTSYYFVLLNGELSYYEQSRHGAAAVSAVSDTEGAPVSLGASKKSLKCEHITGVTYKPKEDCVTIDFKQNNSKGSWTLKVDPQHFDAIDSNDTRGCNGMTKQQQMGSLVRMWARKITRCCPKVEDPAMVAAHSKGLAPHPDIGLRNLTPSDRRLSVVDKEILDTFLSSRENSINSKGKK